MTGHVLLIEDDWWLGESYMRELTAAGYGVTHVQSAEDAMIEIDMKYPDIIVADLMLDSQNSIALFHELQSYVDTAHIPIIVCSGVTGIKQQAKHFAPYGVVRVLDKTEVTSRDIVTVVSECLQERP